MSNSDNEVLKWVCDQLSVLLGIDATEDTARYLLSMDSSNDLNEYICDLLDSSDTKNKKFISELLLKWEKMHSMKGAENLSKKSIEISNVDLISKSKKGKRKSKEEDVNVDMKSSGSGEDKTYISPGGSKKTTFVPLFSSEGHKRTVAMLPGRHRCDCQALKHSLINNCLKCGRVVCQQEGSGPCLFCGELVCTKEEQEILSRNSRKSEKLLDHLMKQGKEEVSDGYEKALKHKNKLLEYDRTSVKRTQVIDDESDYFSTDGNQWLKENERTFLKKREEELRSLRHASRKDRKITCTLDFAGRRIVEEETHVDVNSSDNALDDRSSEQSSTFINDFKDDLVNPNIKLNPPKFVSPDDSQKKVIKKTSVENERKILRVQDGDLEKMSDNGMSLSMHQPWASLLVSGIKRHEGRSWSTPHRGILWIASTSQNPTQEQINSLEHEYRQIYCDSQLKFPTSYPHGCLLGCVEVIDCLAREDYVEEYPDGESESPYVFICTNPRELLFKFPMKGKHKIYKLESHLHKAAKKGLNSSSLITLNHNNE